MPSTPFDAKGLLKAAIRDDNPIMYIEHKMLYGVEGFVPEEDYVIPLGVADVKRPGSDITLITYSRMTYRCLVAAQELAGRGIDAEVIDLRTLKPLDFNCIAQSVGRTRCAMIVHEACLTGGFGGEIAARIGEELFDFLAAPVARIGAKDVPMPFSPVMEDFVVPQVADIVACAEKTIKRKRV
jgi:pyruvate/2-oxoglutarate/acetoin dehydrogenase E1 component